MSSENNIVSVDIYPEKPNKRWKNICHIKFLLWPVQVTIRKDMKNFYFFQREFLNQKIKMSSGRYKFIDLESYMCLTRLRMLTAAFY